MLVKTANKNFSMIKLNEKHLQRGECCAAHSTNNDINLLPMNILDQNLKSLISTWSTTPNGQSLLYNT